MILIMFVLLMNTDHDVEISFNILSILTESIAIHYRYGPTHKIIQFIYSNLLW